ncbi:MAG: fibrobacter succinogenes major paralogous domain-containing protein [Flavobacteriales bacterium]|nr:fibrobacter succinogenes major paralogous domain-containing protein [Flavobacteriales bacterium]
MKTSANILLTVIAAFSLNSCNTDNGPSYSCGIGGCIEDENGSYSSESDCNASCNSGGGVTDADGNNYPTVILGTQEWAQRNLNVSTYRNGDLIPQVQDDTAWDDLSTGAWCYYENISADGPIYGKLYNWYAVNDPRGLAPTGWHVPSNDEWAVLIDLFGGPNDAGGPLKATGTTYWNAPNTGATNASGFTALGMGSRDGSLDFKNRGESGSWWTSTESSPAFARSRFMDFGNDAALGGYTSNKRNGHGVRIVKD